MEDSGSRPSRRSDEDSSKFDAGGGELQAGDQHHDQVSVDMAPSPDTLRQMDEDAADFQAAPSEQGAGAAGLGSILLRKAIRLLLSGRQVQAVETMGLTSLHSAR